MSLIEQHGSEHQQRVAEFMRLAGQSVPATFTVPDVETRRLRARLIFEEALETIEALGFRATTPFDGTVAIEDIEFIHDGDADPIEVIDGCCDLSVVTQGTLIAFGLPDVPFLREVDANNLAKFGPGGYRDPDTGKWRKPPDHKPPDIAGVLERITGGAG